MNKKFNLEKISASITAPGVATQELGETQGRVSAHPASTGGPGNIPLQDAVNLSEGNQAVQPQRSGQSDIQLLESVKKVLSEMLRSINGSVTKLSQTINSYQFENNQVQNPSQNPSTQNQEVKEAEPIKDIVESSLQKFKSQLTQLATQLSNNPNFKVIGDRLLGFANSTIQNINTARLKDLDREYTKQEKDSKGYISNIINSFINELDELIKIEKTNNNAGGNVMAKNKFNLKKMSASPASVDEPVEEEKEEKTNKPTTSYEKKDKEESKKDKGKKGNPFKVLMGIIQKLLDKNWDGQDITRHVTHATKFDSKTVRDCIKIVKEYNRKNKRKGSKKETEKTSSKFNLKTVLSSTAFENAEKDWEKMGVYAVDENYNKKSTRDLMMRLIYLDGCQKFDPFKSENGPKGSLSSVSNELGKIKTALKNRGWDDEKLKHATEGIKEDRYFLDNTLHEK